DSDIRWAISMMRSGGLPRQRITSGNPRRRSRCESSLANPRSSYGRSRRASIACPTVSFPAFKSRRSASTRCRSTASPDLFPLLELQDGAQGAAAFDLFADPVLALQDVGGAVRHLDRLFLRHDDEPGFVPDDPVARVDLLATAIDFAPDLPEAFRFPGVWRHVTAEAREVELQDRVEVPHGAVDHDAGHALHEARVARQFAPDGGRSAADVDHDHIAWLRAVDRLEPLHRLLDRPGRVRDFLRLDDRSADDHDRRARGDRLRDRLRVQASRDRDGK